MKFFLFFLLILIFSGCFVNNINNEKKICYSNQSFIVNGNSMSPLILDKQEVIVLMYYYNCNEVKRGDVVILNQSGNDNLIIKQIKAIPNDTFEYKNKLIYINGIELKNSQNISYDIDSKMLKLVCNNFRILHYI